MTLKTLLTLKICYSGGRAGFDVTTIATAAAGLNRRSTSGARSSSWDRSGTALCWWSWGPGSKPASSWPPGKYACTRPACVAVSRSQLNICGPMPDTRRLGVATRRSMLEMARSAAFSWLILRPLITSMAAMALNSEPWVRRKAWQVSRSKQIRKDYD